MTFIAMLVSISLSFSSTVCLHSDVVMWRVDGMLFVSLVLLELPAQCCKNYLLGNLTHSCLDKFAVDSSLRGLR